MINNDTLVIGGHEFHSRFILGSGKYSMKLIEAAIKDAGAEIITLAVREDFPLTKEAYPRRYLRQLLYAYLVSCR